MKSIILLLFSSFFLQLSPSTSSHPNEIKLKIEIQNEDSIDFPFSIVYQELRKQIHVKSDAPIRSMRLVNDDKAKKAYNTIGSNFVVIPLNDFTANQKHILEIKFIDSDLVVLANIEVIEEH